MAWAQVHHLVSLKRCSFSSITTSHSGSKNVNRSMLLPPTLLNYHHFQKPLTLKSHLFRAISVSTSSVHPHTPSLTTPPAIHPQLTPTSRPFRLFCNNPNHSDSMLQLELGKRFGQSKPETRANAIFWILLLNLVIYVADHILLVRNIKALYLIHNRPAWYQFVTASFCHANWNHLSSNLFLLYIFGKLVEEDVGSFVLWLSYILTGAGANLVYWLALTKNAVSLGASGAVFGLFAISVLLKISRNWRNFLEVLILGQCVISKVMETTQASTSLSNGFKGTYSLHSVNHYFCGELLVLLLNIAHLSGAMIGVLLVWLVIRVRTDPSKKGLPEKSSK